jgi:GDP-mannose 6-dehydrogenase
MVTLIETLIGKGLHVLIFDREVELARLFGANKDYIEKEIPHISSLMRRRLDEVIEQSEVIVLTKRSDEYRAVLDQVSHPPLIIDLARVMERGRSDAGYQGIGW